MDLSRIQALAARVATVEVEAAADPGSERLQALFRGMFDSAKVKVDWQWDTTGGSGVKAAAPGRFSLSGLPEAFREKGMVQTGVLVIGSFSDATSGGKPVISVDLTGGTYHKVRGHDGGGQFNRDEAVDLGQYAVDPATFQVVGGNDFSDAVSGLNSLIQEMAENPPENSLSQSKDAVRKRVQERSYKEMSEKGRSESEARLSELGDYADTGRVVDMLGGPGGEFGPADVRFILQKRGRTPDKDSYQALRSELTDAGLMFSPGLTLQLASSPADVSSSIRALADEIDSEAAPSRAAAVAAIRRVASSLR